MRTFFFSPLLLFSWWHRRRCSAWLVPEWPCYIELCRMIQFTALLLPSSQGWWMALIYHHGLTFLPAHACTECRWNATCFMLMVISHGQTHVEIFNRAIHEHPCSQFISTHIPLLGRHLWLLLTEVRHRRWSVLSKPCFLFSCISGPYEWPHQAGNSMLCLHPCYLSCVSHFHLHHL